MSSQSLILLALVTFHTPLHLLILIRSLQTATFAINNILNAGHVLNQFLLIEVILFMQLPRNCPRSVQEKTIMNHYLSL